MNLVVKTHMEKFDGAPRAPGEIITQEQIDGWPEDKKTGRAAKPGISQQVIAALISQKKIAYEGDDVGSDNQAVSHLHARFDTLHGTVTEKMDALAADNAAMHKKLDDLLAHLKTLKK